MKIARRFNAGCRLPSAQVPKGRLKVPKDVDPALTRWAIVGCPYGTEHPRDTSDFRAVSRPNFGALNFEISLSFELSALSFFPA
jgi:hypothetical protein